MKEMTLDYRTIQCDRRKQKTRRCSISLGPPRRDGQKKTSKPTQTEQVGFLRDEKLRCWNAVTTECLAGKIAKGSDPIHSASPK